MWYPTKWLVSIISAILVALFPLLGSLNPDFSTKKSDVLLNMTIISDTHVDSRELISS